MGTEYYFSMKVMERTPEATITAKGQATIPKAVREFLHLKPGDRVKFFFDAHGHVVMLPKIPASALRDILKSPFDRPVTLEEMEEGIAEGATERFRRNDRS
jgi:AbrB family looped-hinge helix DNA binding protein